MQSSSCRSIAELQDALSASNGTTPIQAVLKRTLRGSYAPYEQQVILNGTPDVFVPESTRNLRAVFTDDASQSKLRQFPNATNNYATIRSHRRLPDGTQRFVLAETVFDQSRAGPILGSAVSFLDYGLSSNGNPTRIPIGLLLSDPVDCH